MKGKDDGIWGVNPHIQQNHKLASHPHFPLSPAHPPQEGIIDLIFNIFLSVSSLFTLCRNAISNIICQHIFQIDNLVLQTFLGGRPAFFAKIFSSVV